MKKSIILVVVCVLCAATFFSESVAYLSSNEHEIYESYFLEYNEVMGEYYNVLLEIIQTNPQYESYFYKPLDIITVASALMNYKALEKYLNENGVLLDYERIVNESNDLFNKYMSDDSLKEPFLRFFGTESIFKGFISSIVYRDEVVKSINSFFTDTYGENMSEVLSEWYEEYLSNFDFVVSYEPLIPAYEIFKAQSLQEFEAIEEKYRSIVLRETNIPEEWYISYVYLVENILSVQYSKLEDLQKYMEIAGNYPQLLEYSNDELSNQLSYYSQISETDEATDLRVEATQKVNLLQEYIYLAGNYGTYNEEKIKNEYEQINMQIEEMYLAYENSLVNLKKINPESIEINYKLYEIKPQDPNVSYDYFELLYLSLIEYYKNSGDLDSIKENLNVLKGIFSNLIENENLEKDKSDGSLKIINEINNLLK